MPALKVESPGAEATVEAPESPREGLEAPIPGFSPGKPNPSPSRPSSPREDVADSSPAASASPKNASTGSTSSFLKTGKIDQAQAEAYRQLVAVLFRAVGGLLHSRFAVVEDSDEFLPDAQDEAAITPPLGRIAARHSPIDAGENVSDIADLIEAAVGTAFYALKNLTKRAALRRMRKRQEKVQPPAPVEDIPEEQAPASVVPDSVVVSPTPPAYTPPSPADYGMPATSQVSD